MSKKVGNLSESERRFIIDNNKRMSMEEIAEELNRTPELIKRHLMQRGLYVEKTTNEIEQENRLKMVLYNLPYWPTIIASYEDDEIKLYEDNWIAMVKQLNEDVTYTEHLFIQDWLILILTRHRILTRTKEELNQQREMKAKIADLETSDNPDDLMMAKGLRDSLSLMQGANDQHVGSLDKLQKEIKYLSGKIKGDRETRRKVETSADTYWGYVSLLEDEKYRGDESYKAEIGRIAQEKATEDLMTLTDFCDGTVDYPLLNAETMLRNSHNE
jgi:hypothetical protein